MKNILKYTIHSLAFFLMLAGLVFTTSCEEEDSEGGEVVLLSFGPAGVEHGDEITFVGQNLDKVTAIVFPPSVEVAKEAFTSQTSEMIKVVVPEAAEPGTLTLKTPDGDIVTLTILNFEVPVTITTMTASAKPGTDITITGDKLNWIESVTFTSDKVVEKADFVSQSLTELVVTVPMDAQSGFLIFRSGGTEPLVWASETQLDVTIPTITALNPASIRHAANLTIEGTDLDLVTEIVFFEGVSVTDFVSQSSTSIVVAIPSTVETGTVTLKQLSPVEVVSDGDLAIILPIGTSVTPSPAVPGVDNITITGTDLDLIAELNLPGSGAFASSGFTSQSETQIVLPLPAEAKTGVVTYTTIHGYANTLGIAIKIPSTGLDPLLIPCYEDAVAATMGQGGGWGGTSTDFASTENSREGSNSMKVTFAGSWGGAGQLGTWGKSNLSIVGAEIFAFSVYGGAGTEGNELNVNVKLSADNPQIVTVKEGEWVDFEIPISQFGSFTEITEVWFQDRGWTGTIYIDRVGFGFPSGPEELTVIAYDDAVTDIFGQGGGWGGTSTDFASTDYSRQGDNSIKVTFAGSWGGAAQLGTWGKDNVSLAGMTVFAFSVYGETGTDGFELNANIKLDADNPQIVTIKEGEWVDVEIPIEDFGSLTEITEIWFQDRGWTGTIYIDYMGFR